MLEFVRDAFDNNDKGKAFIYHLLELLRTAGNTAEADMQQISLPRLAYLLARSFEDKGVDGEQASKQLYQWATDDKQRGYLQAALEWYVYSVRERG